MTDGARDAVILVIVLVVQQVEGDVLRPPVMRRAAPPHPVLALLAGGSVLLGIPGAVLTVILTAAAHQAYDRLRCEPAPEFRR